MTNLIKLNMKLIPGFVIVVFFSASLILTYITWTTLMRRRDNLFESDTNSEHYLNTISNSNSKKIYNNLVPQLKSIEGVLPKLSSVDEESLLGSDLLKNAERLRMKIISNLRRHIIDGSSYKGHINHYGVNFTQLKRKPKQDIKNMMCRIKKLYMSIINEKTNEPLFYGKSFPKDSLFNDLNFYGDQGIKIEKLDNTIEPIYKTCAVIPNSAALDGSQHGIDIDSHEFILRFNNAPTQGYEEDVGALTSMRIINSQVVTKSQFGFPHSSFYKNSKNSIVGQGQSQEYTSNSNSGEIETNKSQKLDALWNSTKKYLMWDPCNYTSTIEQWYEKPEHPIFDKYFNITSRANEFGKNRFYILDCRVLWKLWELLYEYTFAKIYGTPPTSGFIGIALALQNCERVNVYEYIPSIRESARCHYYGPKNESNPYCTYGSWHPVSAEKLFYLGLTDSPDKQIFYDGVMSIPGVSTFKC